MLRALACNRRAIGIQLVCDQHVIDSNIVPLHCVSFMVVKFYMVS